MQYLIIVIISITWSLIWLTIMHMNYLHEKAGRVKNLACQHFHPNVNAFLKFAEEVQSTLFLRCLACGDLLKHEDAVTHLNRHVVIKHCIFLSCHNIKCVICDQEIHKDKIPSLILNVPEKGQITTIARLANFGNTCYLNSVMQCLVTIPHFAEAILSLAGNLGTQQNALVSAVVDLFNQVVDQQSKPEKNHFFSLPSSDLLKPRALAEAFHEEYPFFSVYEQQDAHEFFLLLMDSLDKIKIENDRSLVDLVFRGKQRFTSICGNCHASQSSSNDFICLSLSLNIPEDSSPVVSSLAATCSEKESLVALSSPVSECGTVNSESKDVPEMAESPTKQVKGGMLSSLFCFGRWEDKSIPLDDVFVNFFREEELHFDKYSCNSCNSDTATFVYRWTKLESLPRVLVLHLMRFRHENGFASKGNESVQMREFIDIGRYCVEGADLSCGTKYVLSGAISHTGGLNNGHYTAFVKMGEKWVNANDEYTRDASFDEVYNNPNIYILFYTMI